MPGRVRRSSNAFIDSISLTTRWLSSRASLTRSLTGPSVSGWARRAAQGALFDWVTGNAILPAVDPTNHVGIQKVDRTTVVELTQIVTEAASILTVLDQANAGLNPLGVCPRRGGL